MEGAFYCSACQIDCLNQDGLQMHDESWAHRTNVSTLRDQNESTDDWEGCEVEDTPTETREETSTFCHVCKIQCKTFDGLFVHTQGMAHIVKASQMGQVKDALEAEYEDEDYGPLYCRACRVDCRNDKEFSTHIQSMSHVKNQHIYDCREREYRRRKLEHSLKETPVSYGQEDDFPSTRYLQPPRRGHEFLHEHLKHDSRYPIIYARRPHDVGSQTKPGDNQPVTMGSLRTRQSPAQRYDPYADTAYTGQDHGMADYGEQAYGSGHRGQGWHSELSYENQHTYGGRAGREQFVDSPYGCQGGGYSRRNDWESQGDRPDDWRFAGDMDSGRWRERPGPRREVYDEACSQPMAHMEGPRHSQDPYASRPQGVGSQPKPDDDQSITMGSLRTRQHQGIEACSQPMAHMEGPRHSQDPYASRPQGVGSQPKPDDDQSITMGSLRTRQHQGTEKQQVPKNTDESGLEQPPPMCVQDEDDKSTSGEQVQQTSGETSGNTSNPPVGSGDSTISNDAPDMTPEDNNQKPDYIKSGREKGEFKCPVCPQTILSTRDNYELHLQGVIHRKRQRAADAGGPLLVFTAGLKTELLNGDPDYDIENSRISFVVGTEYIYEVHRATTLGPPYYVCTLCDEGYFDMDVHLTNREHRVPFFQKHHHDFQKLMMDLGPQPGTKYYNFFCQKYRLLPSFKIDKVNKASPPAQLETEWLKMMAKGVEKMYGRGFINKVTEVRGQYEPRPHEVDLRPYARPIDKWNARRLVVSGLPPDVVEMELFDFLNRQSINRAIIDLEMNRDQTFAFLTFRSCDDTSQFLIFNYIQFKGVALQIMRPSNFQPLPGQIDDSQLFLDCNIPLIALLKNKVIREPPGANNALQLLWKQVRSRVPEEVMLEFINSQLLGTPCYKRVIPETRAKDQRNLFLRFRSVEETTNALKMLHGEIFLGAFIKLQRPNAYVAPPGSDTAMVFRSSAMKRPSGGSLYTDPEKFARLNDGPDSGFRGGESGFVAAGAMERFQNLPPGVRHQGADLQPERLAPAIRLPQPSAVMTMLRNAKSIIQNDTIVTDEEAEMAGHVSTQLARVINAYETHSYLPGPITKPTLVLNSDAEMEELLANMAKTLGFVRLELIEEWKLAGLVRDLLDKEVCRYRERIRGCPLLPTARHMVPQSFHSAPPPPGPPRSSASQYMYSPY